MVKLRENKNGNNNGYNNGYARPKRARNIDITDELGKTRLHNEVIQRNLDKIEMLLDRGALIDLLDDDGYSALHWAVKLRELDIVKVLIAYGANVNIKNSLEPKNDPGPPLQIAVDVKDPELVHYLLENGANPNQKCARGCNVFLFAIMSRMNFSDDADYNDTLRLFLDYGANYADPECFFRAIVYGNEKAIRLLVNKGVDLSGFSNRSGEILHDAAFNQNEGVLKFLVKSGQLDVNSQYLHRSALYIVACLGKISSAKCLLKHGANINARNSPYQETALFAAIRHYRFEMVRFLLISRADVNIRNCSNQYVLEGALQFWRPEITHELVRHLALISEAGGYVDPSNFQLIRANIKLDNFFNDCIIELKWMRQTRLDEDVTVFEIITRKNIPRYVTKSDIVKEFHKYCNATNFPIYHDLLSEFFNKELAKHEIKIKFVRRLDSKLGEDKLVTVFNHVLKYLKKEDLKNLKEV